MSARPVVDVFPGLAAVLPTSRRMRRRVPGGSCNLLLDTPRHGVPIVDDCSPARTGCHEIVFPVAKAHAEYVATHCVIWRDIGAVLNGNTDWYRVRYRLASPPILLHIARHTPLYRERVHSVSRGMRMVISGDTSAHGRRYQPVSLTICRHVSVHTPRHVATHSSLSADTQSGINGGVPPCRPSEAGRSVEACGPCRGTRRIEGRGQTGGPGHHGGTAARTPSCRALTPGERILAIPCLFGTQAPA